MCMSPYRTYMGYITRLPCSSVLVSFADRRKLTAGTGPKGTEKHAGCRRYSAAARRMPSCTYKPKPTTGDGVGSWALLPGQQEPSQHRKVRCWFYSDLVPFVPTHAT